MDEFTREYNGPVLYIDDNDCMCSSMGAPKELSKENSIDVNSDAYVKIEDYIELSIKYSRLASIADDMGCQLSIIRDALK